MICHMFPGQPVVWGAAFQDDDSFRRIAETCCAMTGFDPQTGVSRNPALTETVKLQLFGICYSIFKSEQLASRNPPPDLLAEHSMGIYGALAAGGVLTADEAIEITFRGGMLMAETFSSDAYALGCFIGLTIPQVESIARNNSVYIANYNTSRHVLLAGVASGIESAKSEAEAAGVFSAKQFQADAPLHTPLMGEITADLWIILADYHFNEPSIPLMGHIDQQFLTAATIPEFICSELNMPVYWDKTYHALRKHGVERFIEVGFGQSLAKFNRWIDSES